MEAIPILDGPNIVVGPPGTGKTTRLMDLLMREIERGTPPELIAYSSFTKAAEREVRGRVEKLGIDPRQQFPWLRTIHSACFSLLRLDHERLMKKEHWKEFSTAWGYELSDTEEPTEDEPIVVPSGRKPDDVYRQVFEWCRSRCLEPGSAGAFPPGIDFNATRFKQYVKRYTEFKLEKGLFDFTDSLEQALIQKDLRPGVQVAFIDEAQDLSPLQIALVNQWYFGSCDRIYVAGDDDQAIYTFIGAEPDWLISLTKKYRTYVLDQSYRVPSVPHGLSQQTIRRNKNRIDKTYRPRDVPGSVEQINSAASIPDLIEGEASAFLLGRNRYRLAVLAEPLFQKRIPYIVEGAGAKNPMGAPTVVAGVRAAMGMQRGEPVKADDVREMIKHVPFNGHKLLWRGAKTEVARLRGDVTPDEYREFFQRDGRELLQVLEREGPKGILLMKVKPEYIAYLEGVHRKHGCIPDPKVILTTIHGSKGREAQVVIVDEEMSANTYRAYCTKGELNESETRVAYVGITRTKDFFGHLKPESPKHYPFPKLAVSETL